MRETIASLPPVVQVLVLPVAIGAAIGFFYGLWRNADGVRPLKVSLSILIGTIAAVLGSFIFANYFDGAAVSLVAVAVSRKVAASV